MEASSESPRARLFDATGREYPRPGRLPPSLPEHIRQLLERDIIEGRLADDAQLAEEQLGQRLGVSRTPVREAMRMLQGQGLVVHRRGRTIAVARRASVEEAAAIYEVRLALESHLAASAAVAMEPDDVALVERLHREFSELAQRFEEDPDARSVDLVGLDSDLHWAIYLAADSDLTSIVASYWGRLQRELYGRVYGGGAVSLFAQQHDSVMEAIRERDPDAARSAMEAHLRSGWERVRQSYDDSRAPG
jgi:DNA-binding GntR family transcriptional regulator